MVWGKEKEEQVWVKVKGTSQRAKRGESIGGQGVTELWKLINSK